MPTSLLGNITTSSATITNTAVETAFDQTITVPANTLSVGSLLRILAKVSVPSGNSTNTLTLRLKVGSQVVALTAAVDVTDAGGDVGILRAELAVRSLGSSGSFSAAGEAGLAFQQPPRCESAACLGPSRSTPTRRWSSRSRPRVVRGLGQQSVRA